MRVAVHLSDAFCIGRVVQCQDIKFLSKLYYVYRVYDVHEESCPDVVNDGMIRVVECLS